MIPSAFDEDNMVLDPPNGSNKEEVHSLSVFCGVNQAGQPVTISCWKPTLEELAEVNRTGRVWLVVLGRTMPPVAVEGISPFCKGEELELP